MIKCKYKFQDAEKFGGKEYCTCHNELCEDISFACDKNCQIYEDYKQLENLKDGFRKRDGNIIVDCKYAKSGLCIFENSHKAMCVMYSRKCQNIQEAIKTIDEGLNHQYDGMLFEDFCKMLKGILNV